jgi:hypothetical protein
MAVSLQTPVGSTPASTYTRLEERVLARDQRGAADVFFELVKADRPLPELLLETVRIHGPYTHVPFHQRLDDGLVKFVNNDHCLLSARATLDMTRFMPRASALERLPMLQTIWYLPTGLDPWNQLLGRAPGHYTRMYQLDVSAAPPPPAIHCPDQEPLATDGSLDERLNYWLTLVEQAEVIPAYRVFLGLLEEPANRPRAMAQLVFAGLINVQDRMLFNRSYTTGHKAYRARATVELVDAVGWDNAHPVIYAGVPDMAVGPQWHSVWEMAANFCQAALEGRDHELRLNASPLTPAEQQVLLETMLKAREPDVQNRVAELLKAGRGPLKILDVIQVAAAELMVECGAPENYSMPQHSTEYCNTLRWYFETFDHPHQVKLLFVAAAMVNTAAHNQAADPKNGPLRVHSLGHLANWDQRRLLERLDQAMLARNSDESLALVHAYVAAGFDQSVLVQQLAVASAKFGNDPHNQEICLGLLDDYVQSSAVARETLLFACVKNLTGYRKYGDHMEAYNRYAAAFGLPRTDEGAGDAPPEALLFDD